MPTTLRHGLATPLAVDLDNVPLWVQALALQLDTKVMGFSQGTFASRPAVGGVGGKLYWATDTLVLYQTDSAGTVWRQLTASPTPPTLRGYDNATQQSYFPLGPGSVILLAWDTLPAPGSGVTQAWQRNGFNTSGPYLYTPTPGIYRIQGQVKHVHLSKTRFQQENYAVWVYRQTFSGAPIELLAFTQTTEEATVGSSGPTCPFSVLAAFDHRDDDYKAISIFTASSYPPLSGGNQQMSILNGSENTYVSAELVCSIPQGP